MREKSIFYKVAKKNENTVTEVLTNMMSKKYIRDIVLRKIGIANKDIQNIEYNDISTQVTIQNSKRPDIIIDNKQTYILIENKIYTNTDLQTAQVSDYYEELLRNKSNSKFMVFLVPKNYCHTSIIDAASNKYAAVITITVFWEDLINELLDNNLDESSSSIKESIKYLKDALGLNFIKKTYSKGELIYMYDRHTLQNVVSLFKTTKIITIDVATKIFREYKDTYNLGEVKYEEDDRNIGAWIKPNKGGDWLIFIGFNFSDNEIDESLLFNLRIHESILKQEYEETSDLTLNKNDKWYIFPIPKNITTDDTSVTTPLYQFVDETISQYCY